MDFNGLNRCSRFYSFINSQTSLTPKNLEPRIFVDLLTRRLPKARRHSDFWGWRYLVDRGRRCNFAIKLVWYAVFCGHGIELN